uniref:Uncharacterized protein n=1 Tax=Arundo donax TaxID=35708 RepID=A0A0A9GIU4_ARUDO
MYGQKNRKGKLSQLRPTNPVNYQQLSNKGVQLLHTCPQD